MAIFISHAQADHLLADKFVDLLQTGMGVRQTAIFCTSLEGLGIPRGETFVQFIREKMKGAEFVVMLITPRYYESAFCLCELGATWITGKNAFPILVPPHTYDDLKAVLSGVQSGKIDDTGVLDELRDRLVEIGVASGATARWGQKRDEFINEFHRIKSKLSGVTRVSLAEYGKVKDSYDSALKSITEKNAKIDELNDLVADLKACKDPQEVRKVVAKRSTASEQFAVLRDEVRSVLSGLPDAVVEALYYRCRNDPWYPKTSFENEHQWDAIRVANERGLLEIREDTSEVYVDESHPKVRKAVASLDALAEYMESEAAEEFGRTFEADNDYPFDLANREFWEQKLR